MMTTIKKIRERKKVIYRVITKNEKETNLDTLDKVIQELPDETYPVNIQEGVNNEDDDEK